MSGARGIGTGEALAVDPARGLLELDPVTYEAHPTHLADRTWSETNCYADLWIEVLHALGQEPLALGGYALEADFDGSQWDMFKPPPEDLRDLFGVGVTELNVWRPVLDHVEEQLARGRLLTVEVDAYYLPDTVGLSYQQMHTKTTVAPNRVDRAARRLGYFHGPGYFELEGDDFDGVFGPPSLPPYVELVRLDAVARPEGEELAVRAVELTRAHWSRRAATNPVARMGERLVADQEWLAGADGEAFHQYAFGTCRQCGASAQIAAAHVSWLDRHAGGGYEAAAEALRRLADGAKALQFSMARAARRGRTLDPEPEIGPMAAAWDEAMHSLGQRLHQAT